LATLYRYMTGSTEPTRERVLLVGIEGDEHTLGLQMIHDELAAAGYNTIFDTGVGAECLPALIEGKSPDLLVLGAIAPSAVEELESALLELSRNDFPIVLAGGAVGGKLPR